MPSIFRQRLTAIALLSLLLSAGTHAQERKAYRHVDATGKVTYSQTPPVDGKEAQKVDISPAQRGRGGYIGSTYSSYDDPRYYAGRGSYNLYASAAARQQAEEQRIATLRAECQRQRGSDCDNPATLRYLESTNIPRQGGVVRAPAPAPRPGG